VLVETDSMKVEAELQGACQRIEGTRPMGSVALWMSDSCNAGVEARKFSGTEVEGSCCTLVRVPSLL
jgi:hypothetical protein